MRILTIILKDIRLTLRDRNALVYLLLAPLLIGLIMGAAFSNLDTGDTPVSRIPLGFVNADSGEQGARFRQILADIRVETPRGPEPLFVLTPFTDAAAARQAVERGTVYGVVVIPANFSQVFTQPHGRATIALYTDPTHDVSAAIMRDVVEQVTAGFNAVALGARLAASEVSAAAGNTPESAAALQALPAALAKAIRAYATAQTAPRAVLKEVTRGESHRFDFMGYYMPAMAIFFLMFGMFAGTRAILAEEKAGTLARLLTTPTTPAEVLAGKIGGALTKGLLQMAVLVLVSALLFGVRWGNLWGVALLTLATVTAGGGLGAMIAAFARDDSQAGVLGTVVALAFGALGGNFILVSGFPSWLNFLSKLTINRWAMDGFIQLAQYGASPADILPHVAVLSLMAVVFFAVSLLRFRRRFVQ